MLFISGVHPEYEAFQNGLSGFNKVPFKCFRCLHPRLALTNKDAILMLKLNYGHSHHMGMSYGL